MKVIILAGGKASTIEDGTQGIPKPMATIGEKPILWHIMKNYSAYGIEDFIICGGYKVNLIKDYFADYYLYQSDITIDLETNKIDIHKKKTENWNVTIKDTGLKTATGERLNQIRQYLDDEEFIVTYGDVLSDIDIHQLVKEYRKQGTNGMAVVAKPTGRNHLLSIDDDMNLLGRQSHNEFGNDIWTSAGTFVFNRKVFDYIEGNEDLEEVCLKRMEEAKQIRVYKHHGFYMPIETYKQKTQAEALWKESKAPWKVW
jgi:glucose-1-phosphate cytidylyltransferase